MSEPAVQIRENPGTDQPSPRSQPATALSLVGLSSVRSTLNQVEEQARTAEAAALRAIAIHEAMKASTEALRAEFDIASLLAPLQALPAQIKAARHLVKTKQAIFDVAVELLKVEEANLEIAVGTELAENGKPRYSNAELRAAEVRRRKQTDESWGAARTRVDTASEELAEEQAMLDMLLQQFEAAKLTAQVTAAQLAAIQR